MTTLKDHFSNNFDFLRFWAASFVVWIHCVELLKLPIDKDPIFQLTDGALWLSSFGLYIFFFISGMLISKSYEMSKSTLDYLWKRFLRIWPGLTVCILLCAFVLGPSFTALSTVDYLKNGQVYSFIFRNLLLCTEFFLPAVFKALPNSVINGPLYSLIYEVQCYFLVLFMGISGLSRKKASYWVLYFVAFIFLVIRLNFENIFPAPIRYYIPYTGLDLFTAIDFTLFFIAGVLFMQHKNSIPVSRNYLLLSLLILVILAKISASHEYAKYLGLPYIIYYLGYFKSPDWMKNWASKGDFSFGIYIYGMPISQIFIALASPSYASSHLFLFIAIAWFGSILAGFVSWTLVEKRALSFKNLFSRK